MDKLLANHPEYLEKQPQITFWKTQFKRHRDFDFPPYGVNIVVKRNDVFEQFLARKSKRV